MAMSIIDISTPTKIWNQSGANIAHAIISKRLMMNHLDPKKAFERVLESGPFDDPYISWYPHRWFLQYCEDGSKVLALEAWRCTPTLFEEYKAELGG